VLFLDDGLIVEDLGKTSAHDILRSLEAIAQR
jgi:hypothetical protein